MDKSLSELKAQLASLQDGHDAFVKQLEIQLNSQIANYEGQIIGLSAAIAVIEANQKAETTVPEPPPANKETT